MAFEITDFEKYEKFHDEDLEAKASSTRGRFLKKFPISKIAEMKIDDYVIGLGTDTFCAYVEAKTKSWANIQGSTSFKFGVYYGRIKDDPKKIYRVSKKFSETENVDEAFGKVKTELLCLIEAGKKKDFAEIDASQLSQMFKAKILSLYFPDLYINMCSSEHLKQVSKELGFAGNLYISEIQNLLLKEKRSNRTTKEWSNPKFMQFLYASFIKKDLVPPSVPHIRKPRQSLDKVVDFEKLNKIRAEKGKKSEDFALQWEAERLIGSGYPRLVDRVKDVTDKPNYGYDFQSFSSPKVKRYIEVKTVSNHKGGHHFFLSENERTKSLSNELSNNYYFYLVEYDSKNQPKEVHVKLAKEFYKISELLPCAYKATFEIN